MNGKTRCQDITPTDLAGITTLNFFYNSFSGGRVRNDLKSGDFAGLTGLKDLTLNVHQLTTLPADIFSGLSLLEVLQLDNNQLSTLPTGVFAGLTSLTTLDLSNNPLPASLPASLFADVPRNAITLPTGTTINEIPTTVGTIDNITDLVANGSPQTVDVADKFSDTDNLTFSAMSNDINIATVGVANDSEITVTPLVAGTTTITVTATDTAGQSITQTFMVSVIHAETDLCSRTEIVKNVIISKVSGKINCADITTAELVGVTELSFVGGSSLIGSNPKSGDFAGLTGLTSLNLSNNEITTLSVDIFSGLSALTTLRLDNNQLSTLPTGVFAGLTSLTTLNLSENPLPASLPASLFADVPATITLPDGVTINAAVPTTVGTISNITNLVANGNTQTVDVADKFSDTDDLTFSAMSNDINIATVRLAKDSEVTVTPVATGTTTITVTATDIAGQTAEQTFTVTVNATPTIVGTIADITDLVENGSPRNVDVATNFSDLDTLTFTAMSDNTAIATVTVMDSVVTITPVAVGTATITVTATDIAGQAAKQTFTVTVTNPAPTATGTMDNITDLMENGTPRDVDVATKFSDLDTLTFTAMSDNTAIATVAVMDSIVTVTPVAAGTATITVTATDIAGQTAEQTFTVSVQADDVTTGTAGVKKISVSVSPNPLKDGDSVTITVADDGVYRLFGISGEFLTKGTLTKGDNAVEFPFLAKGIYLLKIQTTHGGMTRKVVKN